MLRRLFFGGPKKSYRRHSRGLLLQTSSLPFVKFLALSLSSFFLCSFFRTSRAALIDAKLLALSTLICGRFCFDAYFLAILQNCYRRLYVAGFIDAYVLAHRVPRISATTQKVSLGPRRTQRPQHPILERQREIIGRRMGFFNQKETPADGRL